MTMVRLLLLLLERHVKVATEEVMDLPLSLGHSGFHAILRTQRFGRETPLSLRRCGSGGGVRLRRLLLTFRIHVILIRVLFLVLLLLLLLVKMRKVFVVLVAAKHFVRDVSDDAQNSLHQILLLLLL